MPVHRSRGRQGAGAATRIALVGLVEAQTTAADAGDGGGKQPAGLATEVTATVQLPAVQQHLAYHGHLSGIGEKSGIARHSAKESGRLIVDKALQGVFPHKGIDGRGDDAVSVQKAQRQVARMGQAHGLVKLPVQELIHGHPRPLFHQLL